MRIPALRIVAFAVMEDGKWRKALTCACWWLAVRGEESTSMGAVAFAVVEDWKWGRHQLCLLVWFARRGDASTSNKRCDTEEGTGCACSVVSGARRCGLQHWVCKNGIEGGYLGRRCEHLLCS